MPDHRFTSAFAVDQSGGAAALTAAALTATLGLAAAAWVVAVWQMTGMDMGGAGRVLVRGLYIGLTCGNEVSSDRVGSRLLVGRMWVRWVGYGSGPNRKKVDGDLLRGRSGNPTGAKVFERHQRSSCRPES